MDKSEVKKLQEKLKAKMREVLRKKLEANPANFELIKEQIIKNYGPELISSIELEEESEEMKMVREIMEAPNDTISFKVTLNYPIKFIHLKFEV